MQAMTKERLIEWAEGIDATGRNCRSANNPAHADQCDADAAFLRRCVEAFDWEIIPVDYEYFFYCSQTGAMIHADGAIPYLAGGKP